MVGPFDRQLSLCFDRVTVALVILRSGKISVSLETLGDGIYTANVFAKSSGYSHDNRTDNDSNYLLLCDVAMGRAYSWDQDNYNS